MKKKKKKLHIMANRIIEYTKSDAILPQSLQLFAPQHIEKES